VLANTYRSHGPTFYGASWTSRIDHIALPSALLPRLRDAFVDHQAGDKLQIIVPRIRTQASIARRDHRPLTIFIGIALEYQGPPQRLRAVTWDPARLAAAARFGEQRAPFLAQLEAQLEEHWKPTPEDGPDKHYNKLVNIAREVGEKFFAKGACPLQLPTARAQARADWQHACNMY
jgi:hypothetical protein